MKMNDRVLEKINAASDDQIVLTLGSNRLVFAQHQQWILENSDLDVASAEVLRLDGENENLKEKISKLSQKLDAKSAKIEEMNKMNDVTLNMLAEERKKNIILEQEIIAYRDELKRSFAKIVQLRTQQTNESSQESDPSVFISNH